MSGFLADSQVGLQTRRSTGDCGDNLPAFVAKTVWKQLKVKKKEENASWKRCGSSRDQHAVKTLRLQCGSRTSFERPMTSRQVTQCCIPDVVRL